MPRTRKPQAPEGSQLAELTATAPSALGHGLTLKQAQFLGALLEQVLGKEPQRINPTRAAEAIGVPPGKQAQRWGRLMLNSPPVRAALHAQLRAQIEASQATPMRWLAEVAKLALTLPPTLKDFYHEDGTLKPPHEWTAEMGAEVAEFQSEEIWEGSGEQREFKGWSRKIKLHERKQTQRAALELLAKYHKLITQTLEITGKDGDPLFPSDQAQADVRAKARREQMLQALPPLDVMGLVGESLH